MTEAINPIPNRIRNAAVGGHVCGSVDIIDDDLGLEQHEINKEVAGAVPYNQSTPNGMGRIVLKKNDNFKEVVEAQTNGNTIFVIKYDFTLTDDVTIPANCILEFDGGSIANTTGNSYKITGNHTKINTDVAYNIFNDTLGGGFELPYIDVRWVGGVSDYNETSGIGTDNAVYFERAINIIGQYYSGLHIRLIGQYYIGTAITTPWDLFISGSHHEVHLNDGKPSSPSMIVVGENTTAFNMTGRTDGVHSYYINNIQLHNIKVLGKSDTTSCFIENTAAPAPGRLHIVEECSFRHLKYCLKFYTNSGDTISGDITISKCRADACDSVIYATSDSTSHRTLVNCIIKDNNLESGGANTIHIDNAFGSIIIDNNILEDLTTPIFVHTVRGDVTITNNYFEVIRGVCLDIKSIAQSNLVFQNNFNNTAITVKFYNMYIIGRLRLLTEDSSINVCVVEDIKNFNIKWIKHSVGEETTLFTASVAFPNYAIGYEGGNAYYNRASNYTAKLVNNVPCSDVPSTRTNLGTFPGGGATQNNHFLCAAFWVTSSPNEAFFYRDGETLSFGSTSVSGKDMLVIIRQKTSAVNTNQHLLYFGGGDGQYNLIKLFIGDADIYIPNILVPHRNTTLRGPLASKPAFDGKPEGYSYFATDKGTNGAPIYWNGTKWVDATGTDV